MFGAHPSWLLRGGKLCRQLFDEGSTVDMGGAKRGGKSAFKLNSVGAQFRKQLQGLVAALSQCQPHYIRCALDPHRWHGCGSLHCYCQPNQRILR